MQSNYGRFSTSPLRVLFSLSAFVAGCVAVGACSSALTGTSDPTCVALSTCCASIGGATGAACQQMESSAKAASSESSCQTLLQSYQSEGYCGGLDGGAAVPFDAGGGTDAPQGCLSSGTCDAGSSSTPPSTSCQQIGACADGETYATCTAITAGGACAASIVFSGGEQIACASCTDCAAASTSAALQCNPPPNGQDAGPTLADSGPSCGTAPALHPEIVPGVYCPFTDAGAVHCTAGQECCEPPPGSDSTCQAGGTACPIPSSIAWQCTDPIDCQGSAAGAVCCATGTTSFDSTCGFYRGASFTGSQCATSCASGEVQLCSAANDPCASPTQCTPFKVEGLVLGTCL